MRKLAVFALTAGAFAFGAVGTAVAAPSGPEGPDSCTFKKGTTTCAMTTTAVVPITQAGCAQDGSTTTTTTTFSPHRGTYNSSGRELDAPPPVVGTPVVVQPANCGGPPNPYRDACVAVGGIYVEYFDPNGLFLACRFVDGDIPASALATMRAQCDDVFNAVSGYYGIYYNGVYDYPNEYHLDQTICNLFYPEWF
ncbi:MAG: hypothetical protein QOJ26_854 [Thermoplasmata archaeon]|jgi:hypothetical protein|nr:hypothetical protein [Thermoplasmata archaeon]